MNLYRIIGKVKQGYINQRPNIKEMRALTVGLGWTVEYQYTFMGRYLRWLCFYDCEYVLTRNDNDMRGYTS